MTEYWSYDGSLTTPPCSEGLKWTVIKQVQPISRAQLNKFTANLAGKNSFAEGKGNNRVTQPLLARKLYSASADSAISMLATTAVALTMAALAF
jgi:carbonic anhydrase